MKKQLRIILFAALLVLLLGVTVLAVSATDFSLYDGNGDKVLDNDSFTYLAGQIPNDSTGYVIKMNNDVTKTGNPDSAGTGQEYTLAKNATYTFDGQGYTFTHIHKKSSWLIKVTTGNVTFTNVTFRRMNSIDGDGEIAAGGYHFYLPSGTSANVTFDNVHVYGGDTAFSEIASTGTITIRGNDTLFEEFDSNILKMTNGSRTGGLLKIEGGTFHAGMTRKSGLDKSTLFYGGGAKIWVTGGNFYTSTANIFYGGDGDWISPLVIDGGNFYVTGNGGNAINYADGNVDKGFAQHYTSIDTDPNVVVKITGGNFYTSNDNARALYTHITANVAYYQGTGVGAGASGRPVFIISGGTFSATGGKVIYDYSVSNNYPAHIKISDGTFSGGASGTSRLLMTENCNGTITVTDGTFYGGTSTSNSLLYSDYSSAYTTHQPTFNIIGGTFNGQNAYWITAQSNAIFNLGDPENPTSGYPQFTGASSKEELIALWMKSSGYQKDKTGKLNIYGGSYSYTTSDTHPMIWGAGATITISGGTFSTASACIITLPDRDTLSGLIISGGDFTVTKSSARIISYEYHKDSDTYGVWSDKDRIGQIRDADWNAYDDNTIAIISGGNFRVNAGGGDAIFCNFNVLGYASVELASYPDGQLNTALDHVTIRITGGVFTTSTNTIDSFIRDGISGSKARFSAEEGVTNPTLHGTYNISGGSFTGGRTWIVHRDNGIFNISGGSFNSGLSADGDTRYIWINNPSVNGGQMNISGGTFTTTTSKRMFNASGADINISGGTFTAYYNLISSVDGDMCSDITISGGTFRATGTDTIVYLAASDAASDWHEGSVTISGGTFLVDNANTYVLKYNTAQTHTNYCTITGGTFDGKIESTVSAAGHTLTITGGSFKEGSGFLDFVPGSGYVGVNNTVSGYQHVVSSALRGFVGSQMRIGTDLGVYFYVLVDETQDSGTPSLVLSYADEPVATLTEYTTPAYYPNGNPVEDGSGHVLYCFFFEGLGPQRMGDELFLEFKLDGVTTFRNTFSVLEYCRRVRTAYPTAKVLSVTGALLNYGAAAQLYTDTNTGSLVNANAADVAGAGTFSSVAQTKAHYSSASGSAHFVESEENGVAARGVRFNSGIQLYVRVIDTTGTATCTYSVAGGAAVACEKVNLGGNRYAFYTGAISLDDFDDNVSFTLSTGQTCTYSIKAFVYYYQDHATDDAGKALARAMWAYRTAVVDAAVNGFATFASPSIEP